MDLNTTLRFPAEPVTVFEMLVDPGYIGRKAEAANAIRHEVSVERDGDRATIRLLRVMPPDVPDLVRKFVGETIELEQTDVWEPAIADGSRVGAIFVDMLGAPVTLRGKMRLAPDASVGAVLAMSGTIKASVPLMGGKVERAVHAALMAAARREEEVGRVWLTG